MLFDDRRDAGRRLAEPLKSLPDEDVVVVGLPRGGVPAANEVARALGAPLDVIVVRELGVPCQPEFAFGAIGENDVKVTNAVVAYTQLFREEMASVERRERDELARGVERLRRAHLRVRRAGRTVVVDDGVATGATARAASQGAWAHGARRVMPAVLVVSDVEVTGLLQRAAGEVRS
ncbi:phosphoribosyltransferase [Nocardia sp. NPDC004573]